MYLTTPFITTFRNRLYIWPPCLIPIIYKLHFMPQTQPPTHVIPGISGRGCSFWGFLVSPSCVHALQSTTTESYYGLHLCVKLSWTWMKAPSVSNRRRERWKERRTGSRRRMRGSEEMEELRFWDYRWSVDLRRRSELNS